MKRFRRLLSSIRKQSDTVDLTVFSLSFFAFVGSILWGIFDGGWEPWIVAILSLAGILANREAIPRVLLGGRKLTPEERIAARDKYRPIFEEYFLKAATRDHRGDAIVHDVHRLDEYPNGNEEAEGISAWFRVGLMGTYNDGILLGLRWTYLEDRDGEWIEAVNFDKENCIKVMLLGEVPYEFIESVNFEGDDYYWKPHLFLHFDYAGEPYKRLFFGEEFRLFEDSPWRYKEITEYTEGQVPSRWQFWRK